MILATEVPFPWATGLSILQELLSTFGDSTLNGIGMLKLVFKPGTAEVYVVLGCTGSTLIYFKVLSIYEIDY